MLRLLSSKSNVTNAENAVASSASTGAAAVVFDGRQNASFRRISNDATRDPFLPGCHHDAPRARPRIQLCHSVR